jgi:hypothetical protein
VVVGVVAPPHADACGAVETQVFPGPPYGLYAGHGLGAEVPFHAPLGAPVIDVPDVQELLGRGELQLGRFVRPGCLVRVALVVAGFSKQPDFL